VKMTPMMRQYMEIKKKYKDAILLFRLGDFYEAFFEDAKKVSETTRTATKEEILKGSRVRCKRLIFQDLALHTTFFPAK